ncbi:HYExAFE family protein [Planctomicrobium sp. SH527]|uniref:HYExAFE family protein n=1 Tax=Planctomicrobium sp. SH527 TaxID=3448123 RepID=UPI003F5B6923
MAKRCNHYDVAFEELLRLLRRPYVSVNETRRALTHETSLKSMDFIVYSNKTENLLVDVKGRKLAPRSRCWENWASEDDISSLMKWEQVFGSGFRSMLVFAYDITAPCSSQHHTLTWEIQGRRYAFYGIWANEYASAMRSFSPSWRTVNLPNPEFQRLRQPLLDVL